MWWRHTDLRHRKAHSQNCAGSPTQCAWCNILANPPSNAIITSNGLWKGRVAYTIFLLISIDRQESPACAVNSAILGEAGLRSCPHIGVRWKNIEFTLITAFVGIVICGKSSCTQAVKTKTGCCYLSKRNPWQNLKNLDFRDLKCWHNRKWWLCQYPTYLEQIVAGAL
jgi:hypothetical protein